MAHADSIRYLERLAQDGCKAAKLRLKAIQDAQRPLFRSGSVELPSSTTLEDARTVEYYSKHPELMRTE